MEVTLVRGAPRRPRLEDNDQPRGNNNEPPHDVREAYPGRGVRAFLVVLETRFNKYVGRVAREGRRERGYRGHLFHGETEERARDIPACRGWNAY